MIKHEDGTVIYSMAELTLMSLVCKADGLYTSAPMEDTEQFKQVRKLIAICKAEPPEFS